MKTKSCWFDDGSRNSVAKKACHILLIAGGIMCSFQESPAQSILLHDADSLSGVSVSWGWNNPATQVQLNTNNDYVSEGSGSIHVSSIAPVDSSATSYAGFRFPVSGLDLENYSLALDAWSSKDGSRIFQVRGLNAAKKIVAGWRSWAHPLDKYGKSMGFEPGNASGLMQWEADVVTAPDDEIVWLEFIGGTTYKGEAYDFFYR